MKQVIWFIIRSCTRNRESARFKWTLGVRSEHRAVESSKNKTQNAQPKPKYKKSKNRRSPDRVTLISFPKKSLLIQI